MASVVLSSVLSTSAPGARTCAPTKDHPTVVKIRLPFSGPRLSSRMEMMVLLTALSLLPDSCSAVSGLLSWSMGGIRDGVDRDGFVGWTLFFLPFGFGTFLFIR
jgi:hypothetical protein